MANQTRDNIGKFRKTATIVITKAMQEAADKMSIRIKPLIRDKLEDIHIHNIYRTYAPVSKRGKEIVAKNKYAYERGGHRESNPYHHTGKLIQSVHAVIDGDIVKIQIDDKQYEDGTSTKDVYNYLKHGTTRTPRKNSYSYDGGNKWSAYIPTPEHNFEDLTREEMKVFIDNLKNNIEANKKEYVKKYKNNRI